MQNTTKSIFNIPGTKLSVKNAQLLVSTGIHSLNELIGGGFPVGTVTLLEEDSHGSYASILFKYFLAEGIVHNHSSLVASLDRDPNAIVLDLPPPIENDPEPDINNPQNIERMKIAFRYEHLPTSTNSTPTETVRHYDLSKKMSKLQLGSANIHYWNGNQINEKDSWKFSNPAYYDLLKFIEKTLIEGQYFLTDTPKRRNIIRIGIHALGSPMWAPNMNLSSYINWQKDLETFLFCLRVIIRQALAVVFITIPSHLYEEHSLLRCIHSSDIALRLESFAGTDMEKNPYLSDYHGFFHVTKMAAINILTSLIPAKVEYVFQLRRRKFVIKMLHLPPDLQEAKDESNKKKGPITLGCGSSDKHLLEF